MPGEVGSARARYRGDRVATGGAHGPRHDNPRHGRSPRGWHSAGGVGTSVCGYLLQAVWPFEVEEGAPFVLLDGALRKEAPIPGPALAPGQAQPRRLLKLVQLQNASPTAC
jgi:multidrug efflux pump subunit AcrA (membrane-fusion protein)